MIKRPPADLSASTVLIVEDEGILRELTAENLLDAGYNVVEAIDGTTGLDALKSDAKIDVLLSDIKLPGLTGYQLAEVGLTLRPDMKVVLMTGYAPAPLPPTLRGAIHRVLQKPFNIGTLPTVIAAALDNPGGPRPQIPAG